MRHAIIRFTLVLTAITVVFASCNKEYVSEETIIETEEPTKIDYPYFTGIVVDDNGKPQAEVKIDIYQSGKLVGTTTTNPQGEYSTHKFPLSTKSKVTLHPVKKGYGSVTKRIDEIKETKKNNENLRIFNNGAVAFSPDGNSNPGDTTLIKISGYIKTVTDAPAKAVVLITYDHIENTALGEAQITDENGYYELLLPNDKELSYMVFEPYCNKNFLSKFDGNWGEDLGIVDSDTVLPTIDSAQDYNYIVKNFKAVMKDCNGNLLNNTYCRLRVKSETTTEVFNAYTNDDGVFDVEVYTCSDEVSYKLVGYDEDFEYTIYESQYNNQQSFDAGEVTDCLETSNLTGSAQIALTKNDGTIENIDAELTCKRRNNVYYDIKSSTEGVTFDMLYRNSTNGEVKLESFKLATTNPPAIITSAKSFNVQTINGSQQGSIATDKGLFGTTANVTFTINP